MSRNPPGGSPNFFEGVARDSRIFTVTDNKRENFYRGSRKVLLLTIGGRPMGTNVLEEFVMETLTELPAQILEKLSVELMQEFVVKLEEFLVELLEKFSVKLLGKSSVQLLQKFPVEPLW